MVVFKTPFASSGSVIRFAATFRPTYRVVSQSDIPISPDESYIRRATCRCENGLQNLWQEWVIELTAIVKSLSCFRYSWLYGVYFCRLADCKCDSAKCCTGCKCTATCKCAHKKEPCGKDDCCKPTWIECRAGIHAENPPLFVYNITCSTLQTYAVNYETRRVFAVSRRMIPGNVLHESKMLTSRWANDMGKCAHGIMCENARHSCRRIFDV